MEKYSSQELFVRGLRGELTAEQRGYYIANFMSAGEKHIGKPAFEMNREEELLCDAYEYNHKRVEPTDDYDCPLCGNKGDIQVVRDGTVYYCTCECEDIRRAKRQMKESGLDGLLDLYTFDSYETTEAWQKEVKDTAQAYVADGSNKWFVSLGRSGSGKSHICTAIVGELLKKNIPVLFMSWLTESVEIKQRITDGASYSAMVNRLKEIQGLYIDDFFKSENNTKPTPADIKLAIEILNYRYNKARMDKSKRYVTIISSERTIQQLMEYDEAIGGRIIEMTKPNYLVLTNGKDKNYRLKGIL